MEVSPDDATAFPETFGSPKTGVNTVSNDKCKTSHDPHQALTPHDATGGPGQISFGVGVFLEECRASRLDDAAGNARAGLVMDDSRAVQTSSCSNKP